MDGQLKDFILAQIEREIKELYKLQLSTLSDLNQQHLAALYEVEGRIDGKSFSILNYFGPDKMGLLRKQTLDSGNNAVRNIKQMFEKIDINFKD